MNAGSGRFAVASSRVVTPEQVRPAAVVVSAGQIEALVPRDDVPAGVACEDFGDLVISPGIVDSHVHVNEPGRTEWEGFETATRAAAAGGVTTLIDMPLNSSPVTTTVAALDAKRQAAMGKCWVDVAFYGGLVPGNLAHIEPLLDAGVCGVKAFLCDSGLPEFPASGEAELRTALPVLGRRGVPLLVHAELVDANWPVHELPLRSYADWELRRPLTFELKAVEQLERLCRETQAAIHVVHLSADESVDVVARAKRASLPFTAETCPHYLHFCVEEIGEGDTRFKCAPPIRHDADRQRLWAALATGVLDTIGSDHSPCPPEMKCLQSRDWRTAWGGINSLQLMLPIVWTGAARRGIGLAKMAEWLSAAPARLVGLAERKGAIAPGRDADLCIWDPDEAWTVVGAELHHRHKLTPYDGELLHGRVKRTYVRGQLVYGDGKFAAGPIGELLRRGN